MASPHAGCLLAFREPRATLFTIESRGGAPPSRQPLLSLKAILECAERGPCRRPRKEAGRRAGAVGPVCPGHGDVFRKNRSDVSPGRCPLAYSQPGGGHAKQEGMRGPPRTHHPSWLGSLGVSGPGGDLSHPLLTRGSSSTLALFLGWHLGRWLCAYGQQLEPCLKRFSDRLKGDCKTGPCPTWMERPGLVGQRWLGAAGLISCPFQPLPMHLSATPRTTSHSLHGPPPVSPPSPSSLPLAGSWNPCAEPWCFPGRLGCECRVGEA